MASPKLVVFPGGLDGDQAHPGTVAGEGEELSDPPLGGDAPFHAGGLGGDGGTVIVHEGGRQGVVATIVAALVE